MSSVINSGIRMRTAVAAAACIGFATTGGAIAGDDPAVWQDHAAIRAAVARAVQADLARGDARIAVTVDEIDERLHLTRCEQPLTVGIPPGRRSSTRVAAEVRCPGPRAWKLYVPVRVVVHQHVVVAARALGRGSVLADGDILLAERETNALPYGYLL
ncbi:MAG: hypothetical protein ACE5G3_05270, partial [Gammaproteobacteria bacterium]